MTEPGIWKWGHVLWVDEKPDSPEAFHERRTHEFSGESGGPPFPRKKLNLGLAKMQFPAVLRDLLFYLHSSVSSLSIFYHVHNSSQSHTPPSLFLCKFGVQFWTNYETHIFKKCRVRTPSLIPVAPPVFMSRSHWLTYWTLVQVLNYTVWIFVLHVYVYKFTVYT